MIGDRERETRNLHPESPRENNDGSPTGGDALHYSVDARATRNSEPGAMQASRQRQPDRSIFQGDEK